MLYNNIDLTPYIRIIEIRGRGFVNREVSAIAVEGMDGEHFSGVETPSKYLEIDCEVRAKDAATLREKIDELNAILATPEPVPIVFPDEPDRTYFGTAEGADEGNEYVHLAKHQGTIFIRRSDPYKYGPERTQIISASPASFSRPSPAYTEDGTKVAAGVPRYETGPFGRALLVEEGTVNIADINNAERSNASVEFGKTTEHVYVGEDAYYMTRANDDNSISYLKWPVTVDADKHYVCSAYVYDPENLFDRSTFYDNNGQPVEKSNWVEDIGGGFKRVFAKGKTVRSGLMSHGFMVYLADNAPIGAKIWISGLQVEQKPYATTFTDGERKPETVTVPTQGVLSPEQGTIDVWVNVENPVRINGDFGVAFHIPRTVTETSGIGLRLYYTPGAVGWRVQSRNDENQTANIDIGEVPEGWRLFTVTWDLSTLALYVDGALKGRRDNSRFQSGFDDLILSSHDANNRYMLNTKYADLRLSRIARTDEEIAAYDLTKPLPVDEHAVKYSFDGELDATCKTMIENPGTAEADPIFELTTNQPTTFAMVANENDEYNMIGIPADDDVEIVDTKTSVLYENGSTINTWQTATLDMVDDYFIKKITGTMGTDGAGIRADGYGTGDKLHGPAVFKELTNPIQDFEIETTFDIISRREIENFRMGILFQDENVNTLGHIGIKDNSRTYKRRIPLARYGPYRGGGRSDGNLIGDAQKNDKARETTLFYLRAKREGDWFDFYIGEWQDHKHIRSWHETYNDVAREYSGRLKYITLYIAKWEDRPNPARLRINSVEVFRLATVVEDQTPYILYPGDVVTFDHAADEILLNGENAMPLKDFGADFFKLRKDNTLIVMPDEFSTAVRFRPRYR